MKTGLFVGLFLLFATLTSAPQLNQNMVAAFDKYANQRESQIRSELRDPSRFLFIDTLGEAAKQKAYADVRAGKVVIDRGKRSDVPSGLVHHWTGVSFIPGAKITDTLRLIQDYNNHASHYRPDVVQSKLLSRNGNNYKIKLRFNKKKVITVVLDTEHDVTYDYINPQYVASIGHTTRVSEVENPGTPQEKLLTPGSGMGFLYAMDTYWRFAERDNGTYVQCETISLTRDIPFGLGALIGRFVNGVPQESLQFTLARTRDEVLKLKK